MEKTSQSFITGEGFGWLVLDSLHDATAVVDESGVIVAVNAAWMRFLSVSEGDEERCSVGADYLEVCAKAASSGCHEGLIVYEGLHDVLAGTRGFFEFEYPCPSPTEDRWFLERVTPLPNRAGAVVSHIDITRRKRAEIKLAEIASRDALTGMLNRRAVEVESIGDATTVLFVDLDGFKSVNDRFGHAVGDEVLARAANRILHQTRPADRVARVGGDEFVVILGSDESVAGGLGAALAVRIEEAISGPFQIGPDVIRIGASVGVARAEPGEPVSRVIARADAAMYEVKRSRYQPNRRTTPSVSTTAAAATTAVPAGEAPAVDPVPRTARPTR